MNFQQKISSEEINKLPLVGYEGDIILVDTQEKLEEMVCELEKCKIIGFDTESRPSFKKGVTYGVSIMQLAGNDKVYIIQLKNITSAKSLSNKILSNKNIKKVGIAIKDDLHKLGEVLDFTPASFEEISTLTKKLGIENTGLKKLAAIILKFRISKSQQVSNWANDFLTLPQINYAATDAWVSKLLYIKALEALENKDK